MSGGRWELTAETLAHLLDFLDDDRDEAARRYEALRSRLIRLFAWRGCAFPEELADETLDRVARKLKEGAKIDTSPMSYVAGVAHRIFQEVVRRENQKRRALEEMSQISPPPPVEEDARLACLDACLDGLVVRDRDLIVTFYQGEKGIRIRRRQRLAESLGISINALRIRAHRLRSRLLDCVQECLLRRREQDRGGNAIDPADISG